LAAGLELPGTLTYSTAKDLGGGGGVVTKLPEAGKEYSVGQVLLEIEGRPVFLVHGDVPLWRELAPGVSGPDVNVIRTALRELGFDPGPDSPTYDATLAAAVDALYAKVKYAPPSAKPEALTAKTEAAQKLADAETALAGAKTALTTAAKGPSNAEWVEADNAVSQAERDLADAKSGASEMSVAAAQDALDLAVARMTDLAKTPDTTAEQAVVKTATAARDQAKDDAAKAAMSIVGPKDLLVVPTKTMRVDQVKAQLGVAADGPVISWTDTTIFAQVELTDSQRQVVTSGTEVQVAMPDGSSVTGVVADVSASRTNPDTSELVPAQARMEIEDQAKLQEAGLSAITVTLVQDEAADTLVVPVTALVALAEGGYAVELENGSLVAVEVGLVADTRAQITPINGELDEGVLVVIA
jgi:peptidoglycan hydrolase-like protein with peptidoglycan-binding domain